MTDSLPASLPQIPFGDHRLSRLILGANPINGGSHLSRFVNNQMRHYFTPEQVQVTLKQCQAEGINTWQSGLGNLAAYQEFVAGGGRMHYIALAADSTDSQSGDNSTMLKDLVAGGTLGVAHHGEVTDVFWRRGEMDKVRDYCKRIRDAGVMVGVSTHIPDVVDHVTSEGWDVDFLMCCVYERHRTREQLLDLLGHVPLPLNEVYLESDPARMYKAMRGTDKVCLAFKILAAGRLCDRQEWVENAFEQAFRSVKPNDAVIVGMYPEYEDQIGMNAEYTRRFSDLSGNL